MHRRSENSNRIAVNRKQVFTVLVVACSTSSALSSATSAFLFHSLSPFNTSHTLFVSVRDKKKKKLSVGPCRSVCVCVLTSLSSPGSTALVHTRDHSISNRRHQTLQISGTINKTSQWLLANNDLIFRIITMNTSERI